MEKRFIVFFILSFAVILAYPYFLEKLGVVRKPQPGEAAPKPAREAVESPVPKPENPPVAETEPAIPPPMEQAREQLIHVETELYRVTLSTRGGVISEWELKKYHDHGEEGDKPIVLFDAANGERMPPLTVQTGDADQDRRLAQAVFRSDAGDLRLGPDRPQGKVVLLYNDPSGTRRVSKSITFFNDRYDVSVDLAVEGFKGAYRVYLGTDFGIVDWGEGGRIAGFTGSTAMIGGSIEKDKLEKAGDTVTHEGVPAWVALQDKYFISALIPEQPGKAVSEQMGEHAVTAGIEFPENSRQSFRLYAGPKRFDRLASLKVGLEQSIDFGWFFYGSWALVRAIAKPLFYILRFFYGFTHNYGVSIILLTLCVRSLFIPLMHKSYRAMKAMQILQPEIAALQKKYKDDRERLNRELMELYKKHGANPLGGCLPMFLQMPVFIALYNVLNTTIELRQAPFCCWITDLSTKDPYYVLPIIMGVTMLLQQKLQPTTMDPRQAKLFMFMPVFFTLLFLNFPSGLVLYWMTNNILTIIQQYVTIRYIDQRTS
jgi:YidC/Oxa1 family membrane protein insertase